MKTLSWGLFWLSLLGADPAWAVSAATGHDEIPALIDSALEFLEKTQVTETHGVDRFKGEWPTIIHTERDLVWLGVGMKGTKARDSTVFTAASVHNILAELFLKHPEYFEVERMLRLATENFKYYEAGGTYNFYPVIPARVGGKSYFPRGSNHYPYLLRRWKGVMNLPNDADDTAVVFIASKLQEKLSARYCEGFAPSIQAPSRIGHYYSRFRDLDRRPHPYNKARGYENTGAFLTWFMKEEPLWRMALPSFREQKVPIRNDVDCVVNSNVLKALAHYGELDTPGAREACDHVLKVIRKKHFERCGIYYPNRYYLHYVATRALDAGAGCLKPAVGRLRRDLLKTQKPDGAWENETGKLRDRIQATAFGLNALLAVSSPKEPEHVEGVVAALEFLLRNVKRDADGDAYWPGGVFFAASIGTYDGMTWRSDAYTTALVVQALAGIQAWGGFHGP